VGIDTALGFGEDFLVVRRMNLTGLPRLRLALGRGLRPERRGPVGDLATRPSPRGHGDGRVTSSTRPKFRPGQRSARLLEGDRGTRTQTRSVGREKSHAQPSRGAVGL
jgi:hypothetical protein